MVLTLLTGFLSATASIALEVILGLQVYDITRSKLDLGWLGLVMFLPAVVLFLASGTVSDRFDRRITCAVAYAVEIAVVLFVATYTSSPQTSLIPIYAAVLVFGSARAFAGPASRPLIAAATPAPEALGNVIALSSAGWQVGGIFGPIVAAFAYTVDPKLAYGFVVVMMLLAITAVLRAPKRLGVLHLSETNKKERPTLTTAFEGLRVIRRQPILLGAISLDLFAVLFGGAVALLPAIVDERSWGKGAVGTLRAAGGIGAALITFLLAARPIKRHVGKSLLASVAIFGLCTIGLGLTNSLWVAAASMFLLNAADSVSVYIRGALVPLVTPPDQQGRVMAVEGVFIGASNELGAFESGVAARLVGTTPAIVFGGIATLVVVGLCWLFFPPLRDVDKFTDLQQDGAVT